MVFTNWQTRLNSLNYFHPEGKFSFRHELRPPATENQINEAKNRLQTQFPTSLRSLLLESNGVMRMMSLDGEEWFEDSWTVWPLDEIVKQNQWHREHCADRNVSRFVFFATAAVDGIQFGFPSTTDLVDDAPIFAWYPDETDDKPMADGLGQFIEQWCCGRLSV